MHPSKPDNTQPVGEGLELGDTQISMFGRPMQQLQLIGTHEVTDRCLQCDRHVALDDQQLCRDCAPESHALRDALSGTHPA